MSEYEDEKRERDEQNRQTCKGIADELDAYVDGYMYRDDGGNVHDASEELDDLDDVPDDWEQLDVYDWAEDALDVEYLIDRDGDLKASKWCVALGGPGIWCDTETHNVELYWWGERASFEMSRRAMAALDEMAAEMYASIRG